MTSRREKAKNTWRFPAATLLAEWHSGTSAHLIAEVLGVDRASISRWRNADVNFDVWNADRYAVKLGKHPSQIWKDWYDSQ